MKRAGAEVDPFEFLAWRFVLAAACLFAVQRARGRPVRLVRAGDVIVIGLILTGATFGLMMWALAAGAAGKVAVLSFSMPFFVTLLAWPVLGERPRRAHWLAIAIGFAGFVLLNNPSTSFGLSEFLALASGLTWAIGNVLSKRLQQRHEIDAIALNAWQLLVGGLAMAVLAMFFSSRPWIWSPYVVFAVAFNIIVVSALSWFLWFWVLKQVDSGIASMSTLAVPAVAVVAGMLELGERPSELEWIGIVLVALALGLIAAPARSYGPPRA
jgi:drug/metabolite transporter (DMT)-like permease